jgi:hypothetical protein
MTGLKNLLPAMHWLALNLEKLSGSLTHARSINCNGPFSHTLSVHYRGAQLHEFNCLVFSAT